MRALLISEDFQTATMPLLLKAILGFIAIGALAAPETQAQTQLQNHRFRIVIPDPAGTDQVFTQQMLGNERKNNSLNRLSLISESQNEFPQPESGCGPIALLNILVWYEKYGLIEPLFRDSNSKRYKRRLFAEIDRRIFEKSGLQRNDTAGSRSQDIAMVLDDIVNEQSDGKLRIHTDYYPTPLRLANMLDTMPNFRTGYVLGYPQDTNGKPSALHAMTLIRADRAGYVTLATWGEKYRGLLRMRDGEQWFIPQNPEQVEIRIVGMIRFIPFQPIAVLNPKPQS